MTENTSELNEIRALIASIRPLEVRSGRGVDPVFSWLEAAQGGKALPHIEHPRLSLFSSANGFAAAMNLPSDIDYGKFIRGCLEGTGRLNRLALAANTDLRLYEMDNEAPSEDALAGAAALDEGDLVRCMAYGMMAVEPGLDLIALTGFGHGSTLSAHALIAIHREIPKDDLTVTRLVRQAPDFKGLAALAKIGGYEIAAICGAIIAARLANCSVLIDDAQGLAAALVLQAENPSLVDHCRLYGEPAGDVAGLSLQIPFIQSPEPGVAMACAISLLRTHVILNESSQQKDIHADEPLNHAKV